MFHRIMRFGPLGVKFNSLKLLKISAHNRLSSCIRMTLFSAKYYCFLRLSKAGSNEMHAVHNFNKICLPLLTVCMIFSFFVQVFSFIENKKKCTVFRSSKVVLYSLILFLYLIISIWKLFVEKFEVKLRLLVLTILN